MCSRNWYHERMDAARAALDLDELDVAQLKALIISKDAQLVAKDELLGKRLLRTVLTANGELLERRPSPHRKLRRRVVGAEPVDVRRLEIPGQQLADAVDRMVGDAREHLAQKRFGIVAV